jgi:hypothetical protein
VRRLLHSCTHPGARNMQALKWIEHGPAPGTIATTRGAPSWSQGSRRVGHTPAAGNATAQRARVCVLRSGVQCRHSQTVPIKPPTAATAADGGHQAWLEAFLRVAGGCGSRQQHIKCAHRSCSRCDAGVVQGATLAAPRPSQTAQQKCPASLQGGMENQALWAHSLPRGKPRGLGRQKLPQTRTG